jgi:hypothetical protein
VPLTDRAACLLRLTRGSHEQARQESFKKRHFAFPETSPPATPQTKEE